MSTPLTQALARISFPALLVAAALSMPLVGCGSEPEPEVAPAPEPTQGGERRPSDGMQIQGLLGTLSPDEVQRGLEPRMDKFLRCFAKRYEDLEILGGRIEFAFRVKVNGRVRTVYVKQTSVGDRETERCLLEVAASARFPMPHGGEAEFSWPLELDPPEDVRPPVTWTEEQVTEVVEANLEALREACSLTSEVAVTAYVGRRGRVLAVGGATGAEGGDTLLDCVADGVRAWEMPNPGSYPAKVTFQLK